MFNYKMLTDWKLHTIISFLIRFISYLFWDTWVFLTARVLGFSCVGLCDVIKWNSFFTAESFGVQELFCCSANTGSLESIVGALRG